MKLAFLLKKHFFGKRNFLPLSLLLCFAHFSFAQFPMVVNISSLPSCTGGGIPQSIRCNPSVHSFKADFSVNQRCVASGISSGGLSDASLSNSGSVSQYYVIDIPGTSASGGQIGYVATGNTFTEPLCGALYLTVFASALNIRPYAGDVGTTNADHVSIGGNSAAWAQCFNGQNYAVTGATTVGVGASAVTWYQIDLPDVVYGGSSPCGSPWYCSQSHGWVNGSSANVTTHLAGYSMPSPMSLSASSITSSGATLSWNGDPYPFTSTITIKNHSTGTTIATLSNSSCSSITPSSNIINSFASCTSYTIDVIPSYGSCTSTPASSLTFSTTCTCITPTNPPNPTVSSTGCGSVTLTYPGSAPSGQVWYWQTSPSGTNTSSSGVTYAVLSTGYYYLRAYNSAGGGCWSSSAGNIYVTVQSSPDFSYSKTDASCCLCNNGSITVAGSGGISPYSYYKNGVFQPSGGFFSSLGAGSYSVQVRDAIGCFSSSVNVAIDAPPTISSISITPSTNFQICTTNPTFTSSVLCGSSATYSWNITNQSVSTPAITSSGYDYTYISAGITVPGYYRVNLTVSNSSGSDNSSMYFTARPNPSCTQCLPKFNYVIQQHYPSLCTSEPIDIATHSYEYKHTDITLPEVKTSLNFTRYYSSTNDSVPSVLGNGWSHTYDFYIRNYNDTLWTVHFGDGHTTPFIPLIGGGGTSFPLYGGTYETLTKTGALFTLTLKTGEVYHFNANNKLANIVDLNGNTTTLTYNTSNLLTAITAPGGRALSLTYSGSLISTVTDGTRTFIYNYTSGNLTSVKDANSGITSFSYDVNNNMTDIRNARGNLLVHNTFDLSNNKITNQTDAYGNSTHIDYDVPSVGDATITYPDGHTNIVHHDAYYRLISENEAGHTRSYAYDYNNNRTSFTDENGHTTTFSYDALGNCQTVVQPTTLLTQFTYSPQNRPTVIVDPENHIDSIIYNSTGNITHIHLPNNGDKYYTYYSNGLLHTARDANGHVTSYNYNIHGDLTSLTSPAGTKSFTYDSLGRLLSLTDEIHNITRFHYNANDKITLINYPLGVTEIFTHDSDNNLTSFTDKNGNSTHFNYDLKDRLQTIHDARTGVTSFGYDNMDNMNHDTDANGHAHAYGYDNWKRLITLANSFGTTVFGYDSVGNKISQTDASGSNPTTFIYDPLNRRIKSADILGDAFIFTYDSLGSITGIQDPKTNNTRYHYNPIRLLDNVNDAAGINTIINYDLNGNRTGITDPNTHSYNIRVDSANRITSITDAAGHVDSFLLNAIGNIITERKPTLQTISKNYDSLNRVTSVINTGGNNYYYSYFNNGTFRAIKNNSGTDSSYFFYDATNHLVMNKGVFGDTVRSTYDPVGNRDSIIYPHGHVVAYTYNNENQLLTVTDWQGHITRYSYNTQGRLSDAVNPYGDSTHYAYDNAGRLVAQINTLGTVLVNSNIFTLDPVGNRTDDNGTGPKPSHLKGASYADLYNPDDGQTTNSQATYTMDANGNRLTETVGAFTTRYKYSVDNLLDTIISPTGALTVFKYDALGNRVERIDSNGIDTHYVLDLAGSMSQVLQEAVGGNVKANYIYGIGLIARIDSAGNILYYHFDAQHNVIALTNGSGVVTDTFIYDPHGKMLKHLGNTKQPYTYLGQYGVQQESPTLYYVRARYYDAASSNDRFLSIDPYPATLSNPQTINRYVYGVNNPLVNYDPTGLWSWGTFGIGVLQSLAGLGGIAEAGLDVIAAAGSGGILGPMAIISAGSSLNESFKDFQASWANISNSSNNNYEWRDAEEFKGPLSFAYDIPAVKATTAIINIFSGIKDVGELSDIDEIDNDISEAEKAGKNYPSWALEMLNNEKWEKAGNGVKGMLGLLITADVFNSKCGK